jgi:hypothetical protein
VTIADIKEGHVRTWRKKLLDSGVSAVTTAKAYRLFRAILYTAVDDGIIRQPGYMVAELVIQRARPAGFEPATGCLEGSCSVRLSYGRPEISVAGEYHASATCGSQCVSRPHPT